MDYQTFRHALIRDAAKHGIPVLGEFELTARCMFRCSMCYVVDAKSKDLSTDTWKGIFDDAVTSGLMFALLTGGEIFIRKDFIELYTHLYDQGVKITLYTNGANISDEVIDALRQRPPEFIAITLYGANNKTYEKITGNKDAFDSVHQSIQKIKNAELNLILRTLPLKALYETLPEIIAYAQNEKLFLNYLRYIGPSNREDDDLSSRLTPTELIDFEQTLKKAFGKEAQNTLSTSTEAATCAALRSGYFINHQGLMQPCAMAYKPSRSILNDPLLDVFQTLALELRKIERFSGCLSCTYREGCMQCYARRLLEGNVDHCPPYLKQHAQKKTGEKDAEL